MRAENGNLKKNWDVVIIGTGFGGSMAALRLANAGLNVLLLERGDWVARDDTAWDPGTSSSNANTKPKHHSKPINGWGAVWCSRMSLLAAARFFTAPPRCVCAKAIFAHKQPTAIYRKPKACRLSIER